MKFKIGQKVWDKYAGKVGVICSIASEDYYYIDEGFGPVLCLEMDLCDFYTATTYRNGEIVKVAEVQA